MTTFPVLKTTAVAQYPAGKTLEVRNQSLRFVDGSEQRYRDSAGILHRWEIRLDRLDEAEIAALEQFFQAQQGRSGNFSFTDPWDGASYPNCSFAGDEMKIESVGEMLARVRVGIVENRE